MTSYLSHLLMFLFLLSCEHSTTAEEAAPPFSTENMKEAASYAASKGGSAVLIMHKGQIIFEDYHNGATTETAPHVFSATKGFSAALVGLAMQEGLISGLDEPIAETITEWQNESLHPNKNQIRLHHLSSLSSGLSQELFRLQNAANAPSNLYAYAVNELPLVSAVGNQFRYGPSDYYAFGAFISRKLDQKGISLNPLEYLEDRLFARIDMQYAAWTHDEAGNPRLPNGCYITAREQAKFGQFLLQKGQWNGEKLIDPAVFDELLEARGPNPGHGAFLWLNRPNGYPPQNNPTSLPPEGSSGGFIYPNGFPDLFACLGAGKNRMYMIPSMGVVIVRQTEGDHTAFWDDEFLDLLLGDLLN